MVQTILHGCEVLKKVHTLFSLVSVNFKKYLLLEAGTEVFLTFVPRPISDFMTFVMLIL